MKIYKARGIVKGKAEGIALITAKPINLLTLDSEGFINDRNSDLQGKSVAGKVLIFPNASGSSVGAYRLYMLKVNQKAPKAIACLREADIITASGSALANIPLIDKVERGEELVELIANKEIKVVIDAFEGILQVLD